MPAIVTCDRCEAQTPAQPVEHRLEDGGALQVLPCRVCGHEYPVAQISAKGLALRAHLNKLRASGRPENRAFRRVLERFQAEVTKL